LGREGKRKDGRGRKEERSEGEGKGREGEEGRMIPGTRGSTPLI